MKKQRIGKEKLEKAWENEEKDFNSNELRNFFSKFLRENNVNHNDQELKQIFQGVTFNDKVCNKKSFLNLIFENSMEKFIFSQKQKLTPKVLQ